MSSLPLKKPKMESISIEEDERRDKLNNENANGSDDNQLDEREQEEAYVALIEHRTKEVEHLRNRITYYTSQLEEAERKLGQTKLQLARLRRGGDNAKVSNPSNSNGKKETRSDSPAQVNERSTQNRSQSRPQQVISSGPSRASPQVTRTKEPETRVAIASTSRPSPPGPSRSASVANEVKTKGIKRKLEQKEHIERIGMINKSSSPSLIRCQTSTLVSSQHKRKMRSIELCPTNDQLFVTSALDGVVNLWQLQSRGSTAHRLSSTECASKERRWPEDIAWHPDGDNLFSVYSAEVKNDSQVSILHLNNKPKEKARVTYLEAKPHVKGIINSIMFMPWEETQFVTAGCDHFVFIWTEKKDEEDSWKPTPVHKNLHSSAVMGVAGLAHKKILLSVGADKRIFGFDISAGRYVYKDQIETKCMSVLTNPCDFNLFMVQTGSPETQLHLYDYRLRAGTIVHSFGWKQESSESQSALINQAWSPDGLYLTSGSADPVIHIFDIRYNSRRPSQSIKAHQKRVFKAAWHYAHPLLVSISSDLNVGLHKIA